MTTFLVVLRPITPQGTQTQLTVHADYLESQPNGSLILCAKRFGVLHTVAIFPLDTVVFAGDMENIEILKDETEKEDKDTGKSKATPIPLPNYPG